jgi:hypothetical protein
MKRTDLCANTKPVLDHQPSQERMKIMASHSSASTREQSSHATETTTLKQSTTRISDTIKRRAQSIINDRSIDAQSRTIIRYGLEINDPWLPELVRRVDAGETIVDCLNGPSLQTSEEKITALADLICRAGDEPETKSAALLVLMATIENAEHPKALANAAKHLAFTRCGELNIHDMVDAQVAVFEDELLATIH